MHTTFRVYGSAIGRTALGCRTVGRGFKNVSRMKGGVLPDDRTAYAYNTISEYEPSVTYTDDTVGTAENFRQENPQNQELFNERQHSSKVVNALKKRTKKERNDEITDYNKKNDTWNIELNKYRDARNKRDIYDIQFIEDTPEELQNQFEQIKKEIEETKIPEIKEIGPFEELIEQLNKKKSDKLTNDMDNIVEDALQLKCWVCKTGIFSSKQALKNHITTNKHINNLTKMYGKDVHDPLISNFEKKAKVEVEQTEDLQDVPKDITSAEDWKILQDIKFTDEDISPEIKYLNDDGEDETYKIFNFNLKLLDDGSIYTKKKKEKDESRNEINISQSENLSAQILDDVHSKKVLSDFNKTNTTYISLSLIHI
jgi:hypothetical protein